MLKIVPSGLLLIFVAFKLSGLIDWSWWWVLSPLWIPLVIAFVLFLIMIVARLAETPEETAARHLEELRDLIRKSK